jgi:Mor family transcriptional regulator
MAASKKDVAKQQVKEDREKVREMYLSGKTVKEIAKETYFSSSYCYAMVRDLAKEKNLAKKAKRAPLNEAMIQDAKAGMTVAEIAKKHFLSRSSVRTILVGYLHTANTKKRNERREAILADYEAGMSSKDICKKHGISASTLYKDMRQIGRTSQEYYHKALKNKTNQRNSDIRSKIERGVSVSTIAKEYGISKAAIYETFHQEIVRAGILQKCGRPRKNTERNALIAKRHREGEKVQALATEYNLSVSTVNTICSRNKNQNIASH